MDLNTITAVERPVSRTALPAWRAGDAFLAGGTWLFSEPQPDLTRLIDLSTLGWEPLRSSGNGLEIAATCTIAQLDAFAAPPSWTAAPLIGQCCRAFLASFKIWNAATVGGNLCCALPAGPMISLTCALDGEVVLWAADGSERRMRVADFVMGPSRTALKPDEIMRAIEVPVAALTRRTAFRRISLTSHGRSGALVIATIDQSGAFVVTVTASTPNPYQFDFKSLPSLQGLTARIEDEVADNWFDDVHGLPAWRRHMTLHFAREILAEFGGDAR